MRRRRQVLEIARWEFLRFFKLRDLILSIVIVGGLWGAIYGISYWQERSQPVVELAVIAPMELALDSERFKVTVYKAEREQELRERISSEELDGLLMICDDEATVVARKQPHWLGDVEQAVNAALRETRLDALGISQAQLQAALAPIPINMELADGPAQGLQESKAMAGALIGLVMMSLFFGVTYLFMSITGEKQQRVSEQIFSMTAAQTLIDGKLLGIAAVAVLGTIQLSAIGLAGFELAKGGAVGWALDILGQVGLVDGIVLIAFAATGFAFWFAVCGAIFATIDDPHSSARNNVLMLPLLAPAAVFLGWSSPDSIMMHVLGWLPLTSMTVMPARIILSDVAWWQIIGSLATSVGAIWLVRRAAGRLYEAAMLMYGKEPGLSEMIRWIRAGRENRQAS